MRPRSKSIFRSCQKFVSWSAVQIASDQPSSCAVSIAGDAQHQPADRIGRTAAVVHHVVPRCVARDRHVLTKGAQQIFEQARRQPLVANRRAEREEDLVRVRRLTHFDRTARRVRFVRDGLSKPAQPAIEQPVTLLDRSRAFVGEIVGRAGERIDAPRRGAACRWGTSRDATGKFS